MRRVQGSAGVPLIENSSPAKGKWRIRWDVQEQEDGSVTYMEEEFNHKPSEEEIREKVIAWYNEQIDEAILSGFEYEGVPVWLSSENQFNFKAAYDLAVQTAGATLPVKFKLGTDDAPVYRTFETLNDLSAFFVAAMQYIQTTLNEGWETKDAFDITPYQT